MSHREEGLGHCLIPLASRFTKICLGTSRSTHRKGMSSSMESPKVVKKCSHTKRKKNGAL